MGWISRMNWGQMRKADLGCRLRKKLWKRGDSYLYEIRVLRPKRGPSAIHTRLLTLAFRDDNLGQQVCVWDAGYQHSRAGLRLQRPTSGIEEDPADPRLAYTKVSKGRSHFYRIVCLLPHLCQGLRDHRIANFETFQEES